MSRLADKVAQERSCRNPPYPPSPDGDRTIYEDMADRPEKRRRALEWQMHLEDLLIQSGGVTGGG
ncbi:hypothetical protein NKDENANG_02098 [Candidatus Entotheonellaceae bacterium PAL068K]